MAGIDLPTGIDDTYADDPGDESVKAHQQHHDTLHAWAGTYEASPAPSTGDVLTWDGSLWDAATPITGGHRAMVFVASDDAPAAIQANADYTCDGTNDEEQINAALVDAAVLSSRSGPTGAEQRGKVVLSGGEFNINSPLVMYTATTLWGSGYGTVLKPTSSMTSSHALIQAAATDTHLLDIGYMYLHGNSSTSSCHGIHLVGGTNPSSYPDSSADHQHVIHDIFYNKFSGTGRHGIWLQDRQWGSMIHHVSGSASGNGIYINGTSDIHISDCHVRSAGTGYSGVYLNGANCWVTGVKAFYCDTGFTVGYRQQLAGCQAQDSRIGFDFTSTDSIATGIGVDSIGDYGIQISQNRVVVQGTVLHWNGSRYTGTCLGGIRFVGTPTDCHVQGTVGGSAALYSSGKVVNTPAEGYRDFIRISDGSTLISRG